MMYQYFVKIVPTIYVKTDGEVSALSLNCEAPFRSRLLKPSVYLLQIQHKLDYGGLEEGTLPWK